MGKSKFFTAIFVIFFPVMTYAYVDVSLRDKVIEATLYCLETEKQPSSKTLSPIKENKPLLEFGDDNNDLHLSIGLQFGYIKGNTAYDFDHHTSELEFPMDNVMGGGKLSCAYKNLSINAEIWAPLEDYAGFNQKNKDWTNGVLISYTKSKAYMDAIICDANLRYDFYKKSALQAENQRGDITLSDEGSLRRAIKFDEITAGILLGYKYERFDYDLYDLFYQNDGPTTNQGEIIGTYKIKHYLPYFGLATDLLRENWGLGMNIKYSFYPTAEDVDNHLLRGLTFYGDYDKHREAVMGGIYAFWNFMKDWKLKAGADGTFIRIDGRTWEESLDPAWNKDQSTDTKYWIFWSEIEYKF